MKEWRCPRCNEMSTVVIGESGDFNCLRCCREIKLKKEIEKEHNKVLDLKIEMLYLKEEISNLKRELNEKITSKRTTRIYSERGQKAGQMLYSDSVNTTGGLAKVYKQNIVISKIIEKGYRMLFYVVDI